MALSGHGRVVLLSRRQIWLGLSVCAIVLLAGAKSALALSVFGPTETGVPEIDPTTAVSGLMLCAGGAMLLLERYRSRK